MSQVATNHVGWEVQEFRADGWHGVTKYVSGKPHAFVEKVHAEDFYKLLVNVYPEKEFRVYEKLS